MTKTTGNLIVAFSVAHDRGHINFIGDLIEAFDAAPFAYEQQIDEGGRDSQESWVRFKVSPKDEIKALDLARRVSRREDR